MRLALLATEPHFLTHIAPLAQHAQAIAVIPEPATRREAPEHDATRRLAQQHGIEVAWQPDAGDVVVVASFSDHKLARRMGARRIVVMEHGSGQGYDGTQSGSYPGGTGRDDAALFLTPNEYSARRWRARYPRIPAVAIGSPRLDTLPQRVPGDGPVVAVSFHWECVVGGPWSGNAWREFRIALPSLSQRVEVLGHGHPRAMPMLESVYRRMGIEVVRDFDAVCRRADLYICDNSSTLFEFAATGRPVVVLNSKRWPRGRGPGLRFWDAAGVGINVDRPEELWPAVEQALSDPGDVALDRERALDVVYAYRTGAAARAVEAIASVVGVAA